VISKLVKWAFVDLDNHSIKDKKVQAMKLHLEVPTIFTNNSSTVGNKRESQASKTTLSSSCSYHDPSAPTVGFSKAENPQNVFNAYGGEIVTPSSVIFAICKLQNSHIC
jgi:hypothetical protein